MEDVLFSTDEENPSAALTGENFKQDDSNSSEEQTHENPYKGGQLFHVTGSENRGIASVLDPKDFEER